MSGDIRSGTLTQASEAKGYWTSYNHAQAEKPFLKRKRWTKHSLNLEILTIYWGSTQPNQAIARMQRRVSDVYAKNIESHIGRDDMDRRTDSLSESRIYKEFENGNRGRKGEGKQKALYVSLEPTLGLSSGRQSAGWAIWCLLQLFNSASEGQQQLRTAPRCQLCACPPRPAPESDLMELSGSMKFFFIWFFFHPVKTWNCS